MHAALLGTQQGGNGRTDSCEQCDYSIPGVNQSEDLGFAELAVLGLLDQVRNPAVTCGVFTDALAVLIHLVAAQVASCSRPCKPAGVVSVDISLDGDDVEISFKAEQMWGDVPDLAAVKEPDEPWRGDDRGQDEDETKREGRCVQKPSGEDDYDQC